MGIFNWSSKGSSSGGSRSAEEPKTPTKDEAAAVAESSQIGMDPAADAVLQSIIGVGAVSHHGLPHDATCMCFTGGLLVLGTARGAIKVLGASGIEMTFYNREQLLYGMESSSAIPVTHVAVINGSHVLGVFGNCAVQVWELATANMVSSLPQSWSATGVTAVHVAPDSLFSYVYLGGDNGIVYVVKALPECEVCSYVVLRSDVGLPDDAPETGLADEVSCLVTCPADENTLLIGYEYGGAVVWNIKDRKASAVMKRSETKSRVRSNSSASGIGEDDTKSDGASSTGGGEYDEEPWRRLRCASWHPDCRHVALGYDDGAYEVWDTDHADVVPTPQYCELAPDHPDHPSGGRETLEGEEKHVAISKLAWVPMLGCEGKSALVVLGGYVGNKHLAGGGRRSCAHLLQPAGSRDASEEGGGKKGKRRMSFFWRGAGDGDHHHDRRTQERRRVRLQIRPGLARYGPRPRPCLLCLPRSHPFAPPGRRPRRVSVDVVQRACTAV